MADPSLDFNALQESLETEFCPPLDSTVVAIILGDFISEEKPTEAIIRTLRDQLSVLAASAVADQDDLAKDFQELQLSAPSASTEDSRDVDSVFSQTGLDTCSSSGSSASPPSEMTSTELISALTFLQRAFPQTPMNKLKARLEGPDLDMQRIVEDLLSEEYVRDMAERGLEEDESLEDEVEKWSVVSRKSKSTPVAPKITAKKRKAKGKTITISDVRQQQHVRPASQFRSGDPWSQVLSLSSYLETQLNRPSSFFQSYFHKSEYPTPSMALRAALKAIVQQLKERSPVDEIPDQSTALFTLLEFIIASPECNYETLDSEARYQLCTDAELSLEAANGSPDVALDIVKLLQEMESDSESMQEMGLYHSPASPLSATSSSSSNNSKDFPFVNSTAWVGSLTSPESSSANTPNTLVAPSSTPHQRPPPAPSQPGWQQVTPARPKPPAVHPLAAHIPSYNPLNVPRRKPRPTHPSLMNPATAGSSTANGRHSRALGGYKTQIEACNARRDEALRTASRHWTGGGARGRGGEVALFYALEAQKHQAEARRLQLDAVREVVDGKRFATSSTDTIDVHYCTVAEALTIVREVLEEGWTSAGRPLKVVTGRGSHSSGGVAVLGPAVKNALEREGWKVGVWQGGLSVRGRG